MTQRLEAQVGERHHLDVRGGVGGDAVAREGKSHGVRMQLCAYWMSMLATPGRLPTLPDITT
jgi:hypothetical protein